jgi:hypothetical protein
MLVQCVRVDVSHCYFCLRCFEDQTSACYRQLVEVNQRMCLSSKWEAGSIQHVQILVCVVCCNLRYLHQAS